MDENNSELIRGETPEENTAVAAVAETEEKEKDKDKKHSGRYGKIETVEEKDDDKKDIAKDRIKYRLVKYGSIALATVIVFGIAGLIALRYVKRAGYVNSVVSAFSSEKYEEASYLYSAYSREISHSISFPDKMISIINTVVDDYRSGTVSREKAEKIFSIIEGFGMSDLIATVSNARNNLDKFDNRADSGFEEYTFAYEQVTANDEDFSGVISATSVNGAPLERNEEYPEMTFSAHNAIDGLYNTSWGVITDSSGGAGAEIKFVLRSKKPIRGIKLINGNQYLPENSFYTFYGQVCDFTVEFDNGTFYNFTADYDNGRGALQMFPLNEPVTSDSVTITVNSGYLGSKYSTSVCLAEFGIFS